MTFCAGVRFINLVERSKPEVVAIGGFNADRRLWRIPAREAIIGIQAGLWVFHIEHPLKLVKLVVSSCGERLTTEAGDGPLLLLPEYPEPRLAIAPKARVESRLSDLRNGVDQFLSAIP